MDEVNGIRCNFHEALLIDKMVTIVKDGRVFEAETLRDDVKQILICVKFFSPFFDV